MISRPIKEGFRGVTRHWGMSISSALAVAITLIIISVFMITSYHIQRFTVSMETSFKIYAGVETKYESEEQEKKIREQIEAIDGVQNVTFYTKDEEFQFYIDSLEDERTKEVYLPYKDSNPMHDAFYVETEEGKDIEAIADQIKAIEGIRQDVTFGGQSTVNMVSALRKVRRGGSILVIVVSLLAILLIQNTIKLTIMARQDEITIMRNVGATNRFIRLPFVMEGVIIGIIGAIVPIVVTAYGYRYIYRATGGTVLSNMFKLVTPNPFILYVCLALLAIGILVGLVGSFISVTRYLRGGR